MNGSEIVETLPDVVKFLMEKGNLVLAGGYIRDFILGVRPKDIDLFGNVDKIVQLSSELYKQPWKEKLHGHIKISEDKFVHTAKLNDSPFPVQMIAVRSETGEEATPEQIIGKFDFTINQAAITYSNGTASEMITSERFFRDLISRQLIFNEKSQPIRGLGPTLMRVIKFAASGYKVDVPSLARIISQLTKTDYDALLLILGTGNYL